MNTDDLVSTIEAPGAFDALTKLRPGEPYFALIGRDRLAPKLVLEWAHQNRKRTHAEHDAGTMDDKRLDYELRKSTQAEHVAWAMVAYKDGHPADSSMETTDETEHYSGFKIDEATAARDRQITLRNRASNRIHNGIASLAEAQEVMKQIDMNDVDSLQALIDYLKILADELTPPRRGIPAAATVDNEAV